MVAPPPDEDASASTRMMSNSFHGSKIVSYDTNVMLAAIISLLVVILFVLLLHVFARWFLVQARQRSRGPVSVPRAVPDPTSNVNSAAPPQGLESSLISSIPLFVYKRADLEVEECSVCLSPFEDDEVGRKLPKCSHAFHVGCIDTWLHSHSTCPICRSPLLLLMSFHTTATTKAAHSNPNDVVLIASAETTLLPSAPHGMEVIEIICS